MSLKAVPHGSGPVDTLRALDRESPRSRKFYVYTMLQQLEIAV